MLSRALPIAFCLVGTLAVGNYLAAQPTTRPRPSRGVIVRVSPGELVLRDRDGAEMVVPLDATARVNVDLEPATIDDLKEGMRVTVLPLPPTDAAGPTVAVTAMSPGINGTISQLDGPRLTIRVGGGSEPEKFVEFTLTDSTKILSPSVARNRQMEPGGLRTLADLAVGSRVSVIGVPPVAAKVILLPSRAP